MLLFFLAFQFGCNSEKSAETQNSEKKPLLVFLVRHAEKTDLSRDPELSDLGKERALELTKILRSTNIEYIHSSDYIRTRETAAPTAEKFGLTIEIYDPGNLESLAQKIKNKGGNHLEVGHSNTTPTLVSLLGGNPEIEMIEENEFDRLYIVIDSDFGNTSSILMRYGSSDSENNGKVENDQN